MDLKCFDLNYRTFYSGKPVMTHFPDWDRLVQADDPGFTSTVRSSACITQEELLDLDISTP